MSQLTAITRAQYADKRWKRYTSYSFAAKDAVAPLVVQEMPTACMHMPIGFVDTGKGFQLVAVLGLQKDMNLWVTPEGRWVGPYVPAVYRGYPFTLARSEDERRVLCVREDSGLVTSSGGEPFFDEKGEISQPLKDVMSFLEQVAVNNQKTLALCALLAKHNLIQPWNVTLKFNEEERALEGLYRVDEAALNQLPSEDFDVLRKAGALPLVYCQLLSMQHLRRLGQLADKHAARATAEAAAEAPGELDLEFLRDDNIRFQ